MSKGVNRVILIGNLGADPELKSTAAGTPVCDFRLATNRRWNDKVGELREEVEWHRVVAWDRLATVCGRYLTKGSQVYVEGRLQTRKWTDNAGSTRYTTEVVASQIIFLSGSRQVMGAAAETEMPAMTATADPTREW